MFKLRDLVDLYNQKVEQREFTEYEVHKRRLKKGYWLMLLIYNHISKAVKRI